MPQTISDRERVVNFGRFLEARFVRTRLSCYVIGSSVSAEIMKPASHRNARGRRDVSLQSGCGDR
jgi:hypothetical protein